MKGNVPMYRSGKLSKSQCPASIGKQDKMSRGPYASAIGSITCAITCNCPDESY